MTPVSSSLSVHWRRFSQRVLPGVLFVSVAAMVAVLWRKNLGHPVIVGQAEALHASVTTLHPGTLAVLNVDVLARVEKGAILAQVAPSELAAVNAKLAANIDLLRVQLIQSSDRNTLSYQQLRLEWMRNAVELATAKIDLQLAEANSDRAGALFSTSIVSETEWQTRQARRDSLKERVAALTKIAAELESEIRRLQPMSGSGEAGMDRAISSAIKAQEEELKSIADACTLRAPVDGVITAINRRPGENVTAGESILVLGALTSSRILAYRRQPLDSKMKVGDRVEVATRNASHQSAAARILSIGTQLEPIDPSFLPLSSMNLRVVERGLPMFIEVPETLSLAPAEMVTIRLIKAD